MKYESDVIYTFRCLVTFTIVFKLFTVCGFKNEAETKKILNFNLQTTPTRVEFRPLM